MGAYDDILGQDSGNYGDILTGKAKPVSRTDRIVRGMADPIEGGAQLLYNAIPESVRNAGDNLNNWLADNTGLVARIPEGGLNALVKQGEAEYQVGRALAGDTGVDGARLAGNVLSPANLAVAAKSLQLLGKAGTLPASMVAGGAQSGLMPVYGDNFAEEKGKQVAIGGATGAVMAPVAGAVSRVVQPNPSSDVKKLIEAGVVPTIGQRFGGAWNRAEQKLTSIPYVGDVIGNARNKTREEFNRAALNRSLAPIGEKTDEIGTQGFASANQKISDVYDQAKSMMGGFAVDNQAMTELATVQQMAQNLTPEMARKFNAEFVSKFQSRISPNGHFLADTFKKVDSDIGALVRRYKGSTVASEQELGDAFMELQRILMDNARRANPNAAALMDKADEAYANLIRVEGATKAAANSNGVFTPGQLMQGVRQADSSTRKRAVAKGTAMMQDLASAGQNVIGNTVPNSGTADRALVALLGGGALAGGGSLVGVSPGVALGALTASMPYVGVGRNAAHLLTTARPQAAKPLSNVVRKSAPFLAPVGVPVVNGLLN